LPGLLSQLLKDQQGESFYRKGPKKRTTKVAKDDFEFMAVSFSFFVLYTYRVLTLFMLTVYFIGESGG
jgi:hypothetical protein